MLAFDDGLEERLQLGEIIGRHLPLLHVHVIVVPIVNRRTVAEAATIVPLHSLTQNVGTRVPEHLLAWKREGEGREGRGGEGMGGEGRGGGRRRGGEGRGGEGRGGEGRGGEGRGGEGRGGEGRGERRGGEERGVKGRRGEREGRGGEGWGKRSEGRRGGGERGREGEGWEGKWREGRGQSEEEDGGKEERMVKKSTEHHMQSVLSSSGPLHDQPSSSSNLSSCREQSPSRTRSRSHSTPSTCSKGPNFTYLFTAL